MSEYEKLKKEFEDSVKKLRENCKHNEINNWRECSRKRYSNNIILHNQVLEIKNCNRCETVVNIRVKCLKCGGYVEEKDWFSRKVKEKGSQFHEFANIEIKGVIFFCNENCFKEYKENQRRIFFKKIEIIKDI